MTSYTYSIDGILYRKIYFSVIKNILCLPSKDNLKVFDFLVKCISSLITYGYTDEAKQIYDIAVAFVEKLDKKEKEDFKFVLSAFDIRFKDYGNFVNFIFITEQKYFNKMETAKNIFQLRNASNDEKIIMLYPYLYFANEYLKKLIKLLRKEHFANILFEAANAIFDMIYYYIYQNHENDFLIQTFLLEYNILYYEFLAYYGTNIEIIEDYEHLLRQIDNKSLEYLRTMYSYYIICRRLQPQKSDSIAKKIKKLYSDGHFEYFKYDIISDIVKEFNLPHTKINSLEDE